jgi:hypothetical protein
LLRDRATRVQQEDPRPYQGMLVPLFARPGKVHRDFGREFSELFYEKFQDFAIVNGLMFRHFLNRNFFGFGTTLLGCRLSKLIICGSIDIYSTYLPSRKSAFDIPPAFLQDVEVRDVFQYLGHLL